jgi:hypothetical protein
MGREFGTNGKKRNLEYWWEGRRKETNKNIKTLVEG